MMTTATIQYLFFIADVEHKVSEAEFAGALKAAVEAYQSASADSKAGQTEAALAKLRPLLSKPTGAEERKIVVARQGTTVAEHTYYPYYLAGRCLLAMGKAAKDKAQLAEARKLLTYSFETRGFWPSKVLLAQVDEALVQLGGTSARAGAPASADEIRKMIQWGDFAGASTALLASALPDAAALKSEMNRAQAKYLADRMMQAQAYLAKLDSKKEISALASELHAFRPERVTTVPGLFQQVEDLARALDAQKDAGKIESIAAPAFDEAIQGQLKKAVESERATIVRALVEVRSEYRVGTIRRAVEDAKKGALKDLALKSQELNGVLEQLRKERREIEQGAQSAPTPQRKAVLEKYAQAMAEKLPAFEALVVLPGTLPVLDEVVQALGREDEAIYGPEAAGSYAPLSQKLRTAMEGAEFDKSHPEAQATAAYLRGALAVLEGCRWGHPADEIHKEADPWLRKAKELCPNLAVDLPVSPKVKSFLNAP